MRNKVIERIIALMNETYCFVEEIDFLHQRSNAELIEILAMLVTEKALQTR